MSRNEIKLRKQMMTGGQIQRHRNYSALLKEHERSRRFKQTVRIFVYSLFTTIFVVVLIILSYYLVTHLQKKQNNANEPIKTALIQVLHSPCTL